MRPGVVGAVLVAVAGAGAAGAVWVRDGAELDRARRARDEAARLLADGEHEAARGRYEEALAAAAGVGGATGRREAALDVADEARGALAALDALLDGSPRAVLRALGPEGQVAGRPPTPAAQAVIDRARAEAVVEAGLALEARGAVALAPRVLEEGARAAAAAGSPRAAEAEQALARARIRERVATLEATVRRAQDTEAAGVLAALRDGLDAALAPFPEAEQQELRGRIGVAAAEVDDRQAVRRYDAAVRALAVRVPTDALGTLLAEVEALRAPTLAGGHALAGALEGELADARAVHDKVRAAARDFAGMVLARRDGQRLVYVDRTEVTNAAFARFVAANGYEDPQWWTPEALPLVERFRDKTSKPAPEPWRDGRPPEGQGEHPVAGVCVHEARAFAAWSGKRLPTLEDWRAAAVGGDGRALYPWGDEWRPGLAHVRDGEARPTGARPVGSFPAGAGPGGALDVIGNVRELVLEGADVVAVGGSFKLRPSDATAQSKLKVYPLTIRPDDVGFRCARDLDWGN
ncbi:MAG: formylglycine-generating enzyme family protein [Planctomycetes bacterium]|nr:formylglycine-generating enzyme family protein [Planctomycetota bacterium]